MGGRCRAGSQWAHRGGLLFGDKVTSQLTEWRAHGKSWACSPTETETPDHHWERYLGWKNGSHLEYWGPGGQIGPNPPPPKKKVSAKTNGQHTSRGLHENEELTAPGAMRGESPLPPYSGASSVGRQREQGLSETQSVFPKGQTLSEGFKISAQSLTGLTFSFSSPSH